MLCVCTYHIQFQYEIMGSIIAKEMAAMQSKQRKSMKRIFSFHEEFANTLSSVRLGYRPLLIINSIEDAMRIGSICVSDLTNACDHISVVYPNARFVRKVRFS